MLKKLLIPAALLFAVLAPAAAKADYVCETIYFPAQFPRIRLITTASPNCVGATRTSWICDPTSPSSSCGTFRYSIPELVGLQSTLASAAKTQQFVSIGGTSCTGNAAATCFYYVAFKQ
jgi:hypothetical protein